MEELEIEARKKLQQQAQEVFHKHGRLLCRFGTGSGKTKVSIDIAVATKEHWELLVPRKPLFKTWKEEIAKWELDSFLSNLNIQCYASAHKLVPSSTGVNVILDEAHRITDKSLPYIKALLGTTGKLICLSATVPFKKRVLLEQLGIFKEQTVSYSLDSAVDDNLVADYRIQVVQFALDNTKKQIQAGKKPNYFLVTEQDGYRFADQRVKQSMYSMNQESIKWAMLNRMRFIYNLPSKLEIAILLLKLLPADKKVIVFCGSIQHANAVCQYRFHSKTDDTDYDNFCAGKINRIAVVQSVAEGVNIPVVDYAILMQVQREDLHTIQKIGRGLRKDKNNPNKVGHVFILEATGTQDSTWVASAIASFDPTKVDYISNSQLQTKGLPEQVINYGNDGKAN